MTITVTPANMAELSRRLHSSAMKKMGIELGTLEEKIFLGLALGGEAGELGNKIKKFWRDGTTPEALQAIKMEIADNFLYLLHLCEAFSCKPLDIVCGKTGRAVQRTEA